MEKLSPISNKPIATMKEYGYKDHTTLKKILKTSAMTKCRGLTPTVHTHLPTNS